MQRSYPGHFIYFARLAHPLDLRWTETLERKVAFAEPSDRLSRRDRANRRERLHPRRQTGGMTYRHILGARFVRLDAAHYHLPSVNSHANLNPQVAFRADAVRIALELILHSHRRVSGRWGVLWRPRACPEGGEVAARGGLPTVTAVTLHLFHH